MASNPKLPITFAPSPPPRARRWCQLRQLPSVCLNAEHVLVTANIREDWCCPPSRAAWSTWSTSSRSSRAEAELPSKSLRQPDGLRRRRQDRRHAIHSRDGYTLREPAASIMAKQTTFVLSLSQGGFAVTRDKPDVTSITSPLRVGCRPAFALSSTQLRCARALKATPPPSRSSAGAGRSPPP
jgi:hypothetical protein